MGITGSLGFFAQLDHVLFGPVQVLHSARIDHMQNAYIIKSSRSVFRLPFQNDTIVVNGKERTHLRISPIGLRREADIVIKPLRKEHDENVTLFSGLEYYPKNCDGHFLVESKEGLRAYVPERNANGRVARGKDGKITYVSNTICTKNINDQVVGVEMVKPRLMARINHFVHDKTFIVNPRVLGLMIVSGGFDTAIYFLGKSEGYRKANYHDILGIKPPSKREKHIIASALLIGPLPLKSLQDPQSEKPVSVSKSSATFDNPSLQEKLGALLQVQNGSLIPASQQSA